MSKTTTEVEVINAEQAQVIEVAKRYADGFKASVAHTKGYALLFGTALNQLKEITPHGQFIPLQERMFPEYSRSWLAELMNFAHALERKCPLGGHLKNGQLLLDIPDNEKEKLFARVEEITGDKGIKEFVLDWKKKQNRAKAKDKPEPTEEEKIAAEDAQALALFQHQYEATLALIEMAKVIKLRVPPKQRDLIIATNVKLNDQLRALGKATSK